MTEVAVIIVTHNSREELDHCLRSLHDGAPPFSHEYVVVDNASSDGTADLVRHRWPDVRLIEADANLGFSRACNLGVRSTESSLVLLLNSDTLVPPGALDGLVAGLRARPDAAAVGPRIVDGQGRAELSVGTMTGPWSELRQKTVRSLADRGFGVARRWIERQTRRPRAVGWLTGACLLLRRTETEAVGLLDERYFMYWEDVDLCAALRGRGRQVWFLPSVEIVHLRGRAAAAAVQATARAYRRSQLAFYAKHHPRWLPWLRAFLHLRGKLPRAGTDARD